ncbi:myristoyl transferase [Candidatus Kaiserbacteria bacterium RIFCSPHIGHO2_02_FULL_59_21]|uniref:Thiamine pyrimidine synthase n=2 Tax=Candidatus Kaiseribacteriota TaxID=1752734 RepID=A0A0G1YWN9_9BACT|nr:MAG: NMT1/THI5 like protein domain protein [Candidatus Kaiserbacteria bacterium GW2011_GWA2_58_9]OGG62977.1 MAG: myristoyl transferase [Candidatus Kaiserbacteria bacterium RIFCSPHIGHO2_01_FULL_58_22]OGG66685.1 MAG: myristoyl transferase [Candidatus Kaiserbacteria bacterium RIFCSPHIGHO2_02_FULL_59_21]OGG79072.1 MAG: myristoyl transferase [Candidatus Kaiserbacteria bacterium RIFCSPLOWO2_01_FULL_59_34]
MNTRYVIVVLVVVIVGSAFWIFQSNTGSTRDDLAPLTLAFDWTPNTNHTGLYVALHEKWYEEEGIELIILPYGSVSPDVLVHSGAADLGISSTEAIVAAHAAGAPVVSIAAIIARNTSSLAVRKDSGITRPSQLEGKIYGGYGAPYEEPVIGTIIQSDGGSGAFQNVTLDTDAFEALRAGRVDFTWIFDGWQGVAAKREGFELITFPIAEYGIPDYSTPNIITSPQTLATKKELLKKFMRATARGYEFARENPEKAARMLIAATPRGTFPDEGLVFASQAYLSPRYADEGVPWGVQSESSWRWYPAFMLDNEAVFDASGDPVSELDLDALYTNELFE